MTEQAAIGQSRPWWRTYKFLIGLVAIASTVAGIGYRLYDAYESKQQLEAVYPELEKLVVMYSLAGWRSPKQTAPHVEEKNNMGYGSGTFDLACRNIDWGKEAKDGELFDCFVERVTKTDGLGEPLPSPVPRFAAAPEYWYVFKWISLLGVELQVTVSADDVAESVSKAQRADCAKWDKAQNVCSFAVYALHVDGLPASEVVSFVASHGYMKWTAEGNPDRQDHWVVYVDEENHLAPDEIASRIEELMRVLGVTEADKSKAMQSLEVRWRRKEHVFRDALFKELDVFKNMLKGK
jgi:hypothetical protein